MWRGRPRLRAFIQAMRKFASFLPNFLLLVDASAKALRLRISLALEIATGIGGMKSEKGIYQQLPKLLPRT
jgi:hypothetical protein